MDLVLLIIILVASIFYFLFLRSLPSIKSVVISRSYSGPAGKKVPEAPGAWPIIGHLPVLAGSELPHKLFGSMADKLGPLFTIKIGYRRVLIVSNSDMAKECLITNSIVFSSRPKSMASELIGYNYANFGLAPYGPYWREIRKIIVFELGSHHRMQMVNKIRVAEVKSSIVDLYKSWIKNKGSLETAKVDMKIWFGDLNVNMVVRMMFGIRFSHGEEKEQQFRKASRRVIELFAAFVPSDAIPWLRWLDLGGYEKEMKKTAQELDIVVHGWLEDLKKKMESSNKGDESEDQVFMAALITRVKEDLKEDLYSFSNIDDVVKATCLAIFQAATDTTALTLTRILSLLVNNPRVLKKAQQELEDHVGKDRNVEETDMKNLVYLHAIIKETMRLYPAAPLLLPHESTQDCNVGGYTVPKGTGLLLNVWKIQHDPQIWTDPFEFQPERFLKSKKEIDVQGQHFELLPFGSGRRKCLGSTFALQSLELILASIIHGFEFQNSSNEKVDMTESQGLTNYKATPLELLIAPRLSPDLYRELA